MAYDDTAPTKTIVVQRINDIDAILQGAISALTQFTTVLTNSLNIHIPYIKAQQGSFTPVAISLKSVPPVDPNTDAAFGKITKSPLTITRDTTTVTDPNIQSTLGSVTPPSITINTNAIPVTPPAVPSFGGAPPTITLPTDPTGLSVNVPPTPTITPIIIDTIPDVTLPPIPILTNIVLPQMPSISIPNFTGTAPNFTGTPPMTGLRYTDSAASYASSLLDAVKSKLTSDVVSGATGLGAAVETAIWERHLERDEIALFDAIQNTMDTWGANNFPLPDGVLVASIDDLREKHYDNLMDRSRDIAYKQADMAFQNTQFAVTSGVQIEQILIQHADAVAERGLRSAISTVELGIAVFKATVDLFNVKMEQYKTEAVVYSEKIRAEMLKAEVYKALIEGVSVQVDIQKNYVEIYKAQIDGINASLQVYKTRNENNKILADIEKLKIDIFGNQVAAFNALVNAKTAEYGLYKAKVDGEIAKIQIFDSQVKAYNTQIEGVRIQSDIEIANVNAQIAIRNYELGIVNAQLKQYETTANVILEKGRLLTQKYVADINDLISTKSYNIDVVKAQVDQYKVEADVFMEEARTIIEKYKADVTTYNESINEAEAEARLQLEQARIVEQVNSSNIQVALQAAQSNLQAFVQAAQLTVEGDKSGAQFYAHLAAAAMQAIHASMQIASSFSASMGDTTHVGYGYSGTYGEGVSLPTPMTDAT